jgi:hypothetical protein
VIEELHISDLCIDCELLQEKSINNKDQNQNQRKKKKKSHNQLNNILALIKLKTNEIKTKVNDFIINNNILLNKDEIGTDKNSKKIFAWFGLGMVVGFGIATST